MPPKVSMNPLEDDDEELTTVEGEDETEEEANDDSGDGETSRGDDTSSHDPRLSLATTATMSTFMTETDTETDSDAEEGVKRQRAHRLVAPLATWLLPRSSRSALSCAIALVLIAMCSATVASLSLMDSYFNGIASKFTLTLTDMKAYDAQAALAALEATYAMAAVSGGDNTFVQRFTVTAAGASATLQTTLSGTGLSSGNAGATSSSSLDYAAFWTDVRSHAAVPPPTLGADLTQCINSSVTTALSQLQALSSRRVASAAAYTLPTAVSDLVMRALGTTAALDAALANGATDAQLATASSQSGVTPWTVATLTAAVQDLEIRIGLAAGLIYSPAEIGAQIPALDAIVPLNTAAQLVSGTEQAGLDATVVQRAVVTQQWIAAANATVASLAPFVKALTANANSIPSAVVPLVAALANVSTAVGALCSAVDASGTTNGVSPALATWFAAAPGRSAAYAFSDSALGLLATQGIDDPLYSRFPWLFDQIRLNSTRVASWFGSPPTQATGASCAPSFGNVALQSNALAGWMKLALANYSRAQFNGMEDTDLTSPARNGLISTLVVCIAGVVVITLYGQWGVATRLSASTLPYRQFVLIYWTAALLFIAGIAWVTGQGLAECDVSSPRNQPDVAFNQPSTAAQFKAGKAWSSLIFNTLSTAFADAASYGTSTSALLRTARDTASNVSLPAASTTFLRSVVEPFVGNTTAGDPYTTQQIWSTAAEDDLILEPTMQYVLRSGAPTSQLMWLPPSIASSSANGAVLPTSRATSSCAVAFAARAAQLSWHLSVQFSQPSSTAPQQATTTTSAAVVRARAVSDLWVTTTTTAITATGTHIQRCLNLASTTDSAALLNSMTAVDSVLQRGSRRFGYMTAATVDSAGRVPWAPLAPALPLRSLLQSQDGTTTQALSMLLDGFDSNLTSTVAGMVDSTLQRSVPLKRRVVWGHVGVCILAELVLLALWRLLFGVSTTPY